MSYVCLKEGYPKEFLSNDLFAGITVGLISLPLVMAFAIGSGVTPERGLYTAIIAGFLISLLGGSRVQIGGPTGAFVVIIYQVVERHGYDGLVIATVIAGILMIVMGLARFGILLKFMPYPVTVGFTAGIALSIFLNQIKDFFGLEMASVPIDFFDKLIAYAKNAATVNPWALLVSSATLAMIFALRRYNPKFPGVIVAVAFSAIVAYFAGFPIETIATKFGQIPSSLPLPCLPKTNIDQIQAVFPDAIAIALLGSIESLLSALVADGMTGHRHRSNCELIGQGIANIGSVFFGGIPATGAIARTSANIKLGAKTPLAGMTHAVVLFILMWLFAPIVSQLPLACLAAILVYIAWNMCEFDHLKSILKGQKSDALVLLTTFIITVLIDITAAVQIGVLIAAMMFIKKMSDATTVKVCQLLLEENADEHPDAGDSDLIFRKDVPMGTTIFEITGPFFFAVSDILNEELKQLDPLPKIFILRMRKVSAIDASGVHSLKLFADECRSKGIMLLLAGVRGELSETLEKTDIKETVGRHHVFKHLNDALAYARVISLQNTVVGK